VLTSVLAAAAGHVSCRAGVAAGMDAKRMDDAGMDWVRSNGSGSSTGRALEVRIELALRPVTTPPIAPSVVSTTKTHPNGIDCCCLCRMREPPLNMFPERFVHRKISLIMANQAQTTWPTGANTSR
jgi:hypothetical protein